MITKNIYYRSQNEFTQFIEDNSFQSEPNLLIQIFSSLLEKELLEYILDDIQQVVPQAKIIGATTDGEILENIVSTDKVVVSVTSFQRATLSVAMETMESKNGHPDSFLCGERLAQKLVKPDTKAIF
ncbi:MAG: FIST N-terminal domain-containing protein, partial [Campylobacterota bacterium]|nr:FIST N-terminal domain-containing protein [Campylobacterota bacterium]